MTSPDEGMRPADIDEFVGQTLMKDRLGIAIEAAITQSRRLDDIFLVAPPGTGKSTLAELIAKEYLADFVAVTCPTKPDKLFDLIEDLQIGVVFLDEIHAAPPKFQELLQPAMESDRVLITPDNYRIDVSGITFIAATVPEFRTKVLQPLQDRFMIKPHFEDYSDADLAVILQSMAKRVGMTLGADVAAGLAGACGGTPRLAKRFVLAARDLGVVGREVSTKAVLDFVGVDADGFGVEHLELLRTLNGIEGRRASKATLAGLMCMSSQALDDLERPLIKRGYLHVFSGGRRLTDAGRAKVTVKKERRINA